MVISVGVCLAIVIPIFLLSPGATTQTYERNVDVAAIADAAEPAVDFTPLVPALPDGWRSNFARIEGTGGTDVPRWEVGYLTPGGNFIQLTQTNKTNPTWIDQQAKGAPITGERTIDGVTWELRDRPEQGTVLNFTDGTNTVLLSGKASLEEFDTLAKNIDLSPLRTPPTP